MTSTKDKGIGIKAWLAGQKQTAQPVEAKPNLVALDMHRIAVLPFSNISPDPSDAYFADGMTEELITKLSEIDELRVIARTSVMNYKGKEKNVSAIGEELAVGSIIEGSVRKAGKRIRITIQFIDSQTQEHIWASNYDRDLDDIFAIQSEVASKVAGTILSRVFHIDTRKETENIDAYASYIKAIQLIHEGTEPSIKSAVDLLNRAITKDPEFARAHAALADAWGKLASGGYEDFVVACQKAESSASKALELGKDSAEAHASMAEVHSMLDRYDEMVSEAKKAIQINPSLSEAYYWIGINHATFGRIEQGIAAFKQAYDLDPLSYQTVEHFANVLRVAGREQEALRILERAREFNPKNPRVYGGLAECYMSTGEFDKAQEALDIGLRLNPNETALILIQGVLYAQNNKKKEAEGQLRILQSMGKESVRLLGELYINFALGNLDGAFMALFREAETHSWPFLISSLPDFAELRKDPRFLKFRKMVGLPT